ncbi:MAG: hypothetical protein HEEMFOPI_00497 [Holosporales bacterium]
MNKHFFVYIIIISICSAMPPKAPRISQGATRVSLTSRSRQEKKDEELLRLAQALVKEEKKAQEVLLKKATAAQTPITIAEGLTFDDLVCIAGRYLSTVKSESCDKLYLRNLQRTAPFFPEKVSYSWWENACRLAFNDERIRGSGNGCVNLTYLNLVINILFELKPQNDQSWVMRDLETVREIINSEEINDSLLEKLDKKESDLPFLIFRIALQQHLKNKEKISSKYEPFLAFLKNPAIDLIEVAAEKNFTLANYSLADIIINMKRVYINGIPITDENKYEFAEKPLKVAALSGHIKAQYSLAIRISDGSYSKNINGTPITDKNRSDVAGNLYKNAAKSGLAEAQYHLATLIRDGSYSRDINDTPITDENKNNVIGDLFRAAALSGISKAQYDLAILINNGHYKKNLDGKLITDENKNNVIGDLLRAAALSGLIKAQYNLALLIIDGNYIKNLDDKPITDKNKNDVVGDLFRTAACGGMAAAQCNLALRIRDGSYSRDINGILIADKNRNKIAGDLLRAAALGGNIHAQYNLACLIYQNEYHQKIDGTPIGKRNQIERNAYLESILKNILKSKGITNIFGFDYIIKNTIVIFKDIMPTDRKEEIFNYLSEKINSWHDLKHREYYHFLLLYLFNKEISDEHLTRCMTSGHPDAISLYQAIQFDQKNAVAQAEDEHHTATTASTEPSSAANPTPSSTDEEESDASIDASHSDDDITLEITDSGATGSQEDDDPRCYDIPISEKPEKEAEIERTLSKKMKQMTQKGTVSPISEESKKQHVSIVWTDTARRELKDVRNDKKFTCRLGLIIETLKETLCGGINHIEVLRHDKIGNSRIFSGSLTNGNRSWMTRTYYPDGSVKEITIHSIKGHHEKKSIKK